MEIIRIEENGFPPWSWSYDITWHKQNDLFLSFANSCLTYLFPPFSLQGVSYHCDYHFNWGLFIHFVERQKYFLLLLLSCLLAMIHLK